MQVKALRRLHFFQRNHGGVSHRLKKIWETWDREEFAIGIPLGEPPVQWRLHRHKKTPTRKSDRGLKRGTGRN